MLVVYSGTRNLYECMVPAIHSLLDHNKVDRIFILTEDDIFPYELPECCQIINVSNQKYFPQNGPNMKSPFTYMATIRACYSDLLPVDKVIQLDVDTVICDDLTPLWDIDLTGRWFAAVPEYKGHYNPWAREHYFNIGVCLYNLEQMRKDKAQERMVNLLNERKMMCVEQDALNYFGVPDKAVVAPLRYNECFATGYTDDPAVVHYAGSFNWFTNEATFRYEYLKRYKEKIQNEERRSFLQDDALEETADANPISRRIHLSVVK